MQHDLADLRLFAAIAAGNSLTRGAEMAHTTVSAASARVKNLEDRLGTKLLYRGNRGVTLSPAGQAFAHHARLVLSQLQRLNSDMREYSRGIRGHLRVCASTTAVTEFLPGVLSRYLVTHPEVSIDLKERLSADIVRLVSESHADLGIVSGDTRAESLEVKSYRDDKLVLIVPESHELAKSETVSFSHALDHEHIGLHEGSAIHGFLEQKAKDLHRTVRLRIQVGNFEAACRMVQSNVGLSIMPESAARRYQQYMAIRVLPLEDPWGRRNLRSAPAISNSCRVSPGIWWIFLRRTPQTPSRRPPRWLLR